MARKSRRRNKESQQDRGRKAKRQRDLIYKIDLHGMTWDTAQRRLRAAPHEANFHGSRLIKIIHGWGRSTGSNVLQKKVRNWLARHGFGFRAVIYGEDYSLMNLETAQMRDEIGQFPDNDLNARNAGMTLVWLR